MYEHEGRLFLLAEDCVFIWTGYRFQLLALPSEQEEQELRLNENNIAATK